MPATPDRRALLANTAMLTGLAAGYGAFAGLALRFLYPARPRPRGWMFVTDLARLRPGESMTYTTPAGEPVAIARLAAGELIALSSTCPHLGCQVRWEAHHNRFFCPCHNGIFDPTGKATAGPPADAGQSLLRYPLKVENGLLFIEVPLEYLAPSACAGCPRRGHA
jgi:Rieske Fe-S protein